MNHLNSVLVEGKVIGVPNSSKTPAGTSMCLFRIETDRYIKRESETERETSHFDVESWGYLADTCSDSLHDGMGVRVVGRLKQERWLDAKETPRSSVKVIAEHVEFKPKVSA